MNLVGIIQKRSLVIYFMTRDLFIFCESRFFQFR
jgi:hypothetical protein